MKKMHKLCQIMQVRRKKKQNKNPFPFKFLSHLNSLQCLGAAFGPLQRFLYSSENIVAGINFVPWHLQNSLSLFKCIPELRNMQDMVSGEVGSWKKFGMKWESKA